MPVLVLTITISQIQINLIIILLILSKYIYLFINTRFAFIDWFDDAEAVFILELFNLPKHSNTFVIKIVIENVFSDFLDSNMPTTSKFRY